MAFRRPVLDVPRDALADFCRRRGILELFVFGSVLRSDFRPDSDVDVLVRFAPEARRTLEGLMSMEEELARLLGRKVDVVDREAVEASENYIRRREILAHAERVYGA